MSHLYIPRFLKSVSSVSGHAFKNFIVYTLLPTIPLWGFYILKIKALVYKGTCPQSSVDYSGKNLTQPKCPLEGKR